MSRIYHYQCYQLILMISSRPQTDWYAQRARLGTIYGMAGTSIPPSPPTHSLIRRHVELHLLSPTLGRLSSSEKVESTLELVDRLFDSSSAAHKKLSDASLFGQFVVRSWAGLYRSAGF